MSLKHHKYFEKNASSRIRTDDLVITSDAPYQLGHQGLFLFCKGSYLIMTYPIPSYRYKCYTLNLMVVIQVLYLKAYGCTQYREAPQVPTKFLYSHDNLCYTPWSHVVQLLSSKSIIVNSLFALTEELMSAASWLLSLSWLSLLPVTSIAFILSFLLFCFVNCYLLYFQLCL